jgi:hypothetical protein
MKLLRRRGGRRAVAGVIVAVLIFAMIFTAGFSFLIYQAQTDSSAYQANAAANAAHNQASLENLAFSGSNPSGNTLDVVVNNTGAFPLSVVSVVVEDSTGKVTWQSGTLASPINLDVGGTNAPSPLNLNTIVGPAPYGAYPGYSGTPIYISLLSSRGNVYTTQFPKSTSAIVTTTTVATTISTTAPGSGGGNSLVVVMAATPVQVFGGNTVIDNVTVFNYSPLPMTNVMVTPSPPVFSLTGTAKLTQQGCSVPYTPPKQQSLGNTIPGYSGSGVAPHIYYLCDYLAETGTVGGLASFSGAAQASQGASQIFAAPVTSNLVQIGGSTNPLATGAFSSNFFFFKYSSCTNRPSSGGHGGRYSYPSPCTTNTPMPPAYPGAMPEGAVVSGGSNYYVAFYVQLTNNFNTALPLLSNTFEQYDQSAGGESDWWIVGTNTTMSNGAYYPNYNPGSGVQYIPTLTPYPTDCGTVYATAVAGHPANSPIDSNCIYVDPGQSVVVTLAACGPGASNWDWGGSQRGNSFDSSTGCTSSTPSIGSGGSATIGTTVVSFEYLGQVVTQDIQFQGVAFTS